MVDGLAVQGIRRRPPAASDEMIGHMRVELRLGRELAMVVALLGRHAAPFANAIERDYYVDVDTARAAAKTGASFNAVHLTSAIKVDFFVAGDDPFESERPRSRERIETPGGVLYVDTAEHTMLRKLEWYRRGGEVSDRQWRDVQAIVRLQGDRLDRGHLRHWAARLGVTDLLERVLPAAAR